MLTVSIINVPNLHLLQSPENNKYNHDIEIRITQTILIDCLLYSEQSHNAQKRQRKKRQKQYGIKLFTAKTIKSYYG